MESIEDYDVNKTVFLEWGCLDGEVTHLTVIDWMQPPKSARHEGTIHIFLIRVEDSKSQNSTTFTIQGVIITPARGLRDPKIFFSNYRYFARDVVGIWSKSKTTSHLTLTVRRINLYT